MVKTLLVDLRTHVLAQILKLSKQQEFQLCRSLHGKKGRGLLSQLAPTLPLSAIGLAMAGFADMAPSLMSRCIDMPIRIHPQHGRGTARHRGRSRPAPASTCAATVLSGWRKAACCGVRTADRLQAVCDAGHIAPDLEGEVARSTILGGSQAMAAELEVIVDPAVDGEEALRVPG